MVEEGNNAVRHFIVRFVGGDWYGIFVVCGIIGGVGRVCGGRTMSECNRVREVFNRTSAEIYWLGINAGW